MKEMALGIEAGVRVATLSQIVGPHGCGLASIGPPFAGGFSGRRDHSVQQHDLGDRQSSAGQRCAKRTH